VKLCDLATSIKSANAGATQITMDIVFADPAAYRRAVDCGSLTPALIAGLYRVDEAAVEIYAYDPARTIKITVPRAVLSGGVEERDFDGVQQYIPLLDIEIAA
jgi:Domain of unknown function (DUF4387)